MKIRALDSRHERLKMIDSKITTLKPGELKLLETAETPDNERIWNKYSFETDRRVDGYQQIYRYRDPQ